MAVSQWIDKMQELNMFDKEDEQDDEKQSVELKDEQLELIVNKIIEKLNKPVVNTDETDNDAGDIEDDADAS